MATQSARKAKSSARKAPKKAAKRSAKKSTAQNRSTMPGFISHTEFASTDPPATRAWGAKVFGWKFSEMPSPNGPYHMWQTKDTQTGGGIRTPNPPETPGTIVYVEVAGMQKGYGKAVAAGAKPMMPPMEIQGGMGWMAIVSAPGGPAVGLWSDKK